MAGSLPIAQGVQRVRVEIENGTIGITVHDQREVKFGGGVRRAADTAAELAALEALPIDLVAEVDPADAATMVVRGAGAGLRSLRGMLGYELGLHVPAEVELEVLVQQNGHVTVADHRARLRVTTARGDLRFENCHGGTKARTGRGMVIAFGARGSLDIETSLGDMQAFVEQPGELLRLRTGKGTIQCFVPPRTGFVCSARAEIGRIGSSFDLPTEATSKYGTVMTGQYGDGRTKIVLVTGSGHVSLQKHE